MLKDGARVPIGIPEPPPHLLPEALVEWNRITPLLKELGLIAKIDRAALTMYCQAWARMVQADEMIAALGDDGLVMTVAQSGYKQTSPWIQISNRMSELCLKFLTEFGMSPSARTRVDVTMQGDLFGDDDTPEQKAKGYFG